MGGKSAYEGHLEIRRDEGVWGPVVGNYWSSTQSSKACYELGFSGSVLSHKYVDMDGTGLGPVHVKIYQCLNAVHLMDCNHTPWDDPAYIDSYEDIITLRCLPGMAAYNSCIREVFYTLVVGIPGAVSITFWFFKKAGGNVLLSYRI